VDGKYFLLNTTLFIVQYIGRFPIYRKGVGLCTSKKDYKLCLRFDVHWNYNRASQDNYRRFDEFKIRSASWRMADFKLSRFL